MPRGRHIDEYAAVFGFQQVKDTENGKHFVYAGRNHVHERGENFFLKSEINVQAADSMLVPAESCCLMRAAQRRNSKTASISMAPKPGSPRTETIWSPISF